MHLRNWILLVIMASQSYGFFFDDFLEITPDKSTYVAVNKTILLSCKTKKISELSMFLNGSLVKRDKASYIEYNLTSDKPERYEFECKNNSMVNRVTIIFRYKPQVISARTVITNPNHCHFAVNFTFVHLQNGDYFKISRCIDNNCTTISVNNANIEFTCNLNYVYNFIIQFQLNKIKWPIRASLEFYKFAKLPELIIQEKSSESLNMSYKKMNRYDDVFLNPLYRITYKSEWDGTEKIITTTKKEAVLRNLVPFTMYTIDVEVKVNRSMYWSDKLTRKARTLPSAPYAGPQSTNGSYLETTCEQPSKRCFIIYWAMIPLSLRNGILDGFVIKQDGKILTQTSKLFARITNQPKNTDLWFEIQAKTKNSLYSPPTVIHIPSQGLEKLKDFMVVQLNSTHVNISWILQQHLKNPTVTVMSCLGDSSGSVLWCNSSVKWSTVKNQNFTILKAVNSNYFAASVSDLKRSSPLMLAGCILSSGIARTPQKAIISERNATRITLLWPPYKCSNLNGRPILFQVLYAEKINCANGLEMNISAKGTKPERENIEIKNLKPFTTYFICLRIRTVQGWSEMSPEVKTLTLEARPSDRVTNLQVVNSDNSSITLKWDKLLQPNGIISYHYVYQRSRNQTQERYASISNTAIMPDLQPLTEYAFSVSACNSVGCSNKSAEVNALLTTKPYVFALELLPKEHQLEIKWKLPDFLKDHIEYYMLRVVYGNGAVRRYNKTKEIANITIPCDSYDDVLVLVNVTVVIKYNNSLIYGSTIKKFANVCRKDKSDLVWIVLLAVLGLLPFVICCGHYVYRQYKEVDIDPANPNVPTDSSSKDDNNVKDLPYYVEIDSESQTNLMDPKGVHLSSTDEEEEEMDTETTILENDDDSKAGVPTADFGRDKLSTNKEKNMQNLQEKVSPSNSDPNSYVYADMKRSDPLPQRFELSRLNSNLDLKNRANNFMDLNESNVDPEHYLRHDLSNISQSSSDSNSLTRLHSQTESKTHGYVQSNMVTSGLKPVDLDSNGYVQSNMDSFGSSPQSDDYVQTSTNSCSLNQVNSEITSFVQNNMVSADDGEADSDSNGYISDLSQPASTSDSSNDEQNNMKPSLSSADSNGYIKNTSSDLSQVYVDSNEHVPNMNISNLNLSDSDSSGFDQNNMKPSLSSADSNGYIRNTTSFDLSQVYVDSNEHVPNMNISNLNLSDSDSSGFDHSNMRLSLSSADSNGYIKNTTPFDLSQDSDCNKYVQNINASDSSLVDSDFKDYDQINMKPSLNTVDSNGYIQDTGSSCQVHSDLKPGFGPDSNSYKHRDNKNIVSSKSNQNQLNSDDYQFVTC